MPAGAFGGMAIAPCQLTVRWTAENTGACPMSFCCTPLEASWWPVSSSARRAVHRTPLAKVEDVADGHDRAHRRMAVAIQGLGGLRTVQWAPFPRSANVTCPVPGSKAPTVMQPPVAGHDRPLSVTWVAPAGLGVR